MLGSPQTLSSVLGSTTAGSQNPRRIAARGSWCIKKDARRARKQCAANGIGNRDKGGKSLEPIAKPPSGLRKLLNLKGQEPVLQQLLSAFWGKTLQTAALDRVRLRRKSEGLGSNHSGRAIFFVPLPAADARSRLGCLPGTGRLSAQSGTLMHLYWLTTASCLTYPG